MRLCVLVARITLLSLNFASVQFREKSSATFRDVERKLELECTKFRDFFLIFNMKVAIPTDFGTISKESLKLITKWGRNTLHIHVHTIQCRRLEYRSRMKV